MDQENSLIYITRLALDDAIVFAWTGLNLMVETREN